MNDEYRTAVAAKSPTELAEHLDLLIRALCDTLAELETRPTATKQEHVTRSADLALENASLALDQLEVVLARAHALPPDQSRAMQTALLDNITHRLRTRVHDAKRRHEHDLANPRFIWASGRLTRPQSRKGPLGCDDSGD